MLAFNLQPTGPTVPVYRLDLVELEAEAYRTGNALALSVLAETASAMEYMPIIRELEDRGDPDDLVASYDKAATAEGNLEEALDLVQTDTAYYIEAVEEALGTGCDTRTLLLALVERMHRDANYFLVTYGVDNE